ncbi:RNA-splicing factor [Linderina macrospora]|uniref:RNA-splicing factor n=1 Tax=Linderina macrospora TaxID=4868 RepID=A0ACC1J6V9_9FUNG|nr:RNA-splicing factor [Linderina macrospora]
MGSGDLNMKKSWHPLTMANQRRVAEEKRKAEEEAQRTAKMQKELRAERQREEMERLNQSLSGKKTNQLEWMYKAPTATSQTDEDLEAYLLGKRSIADIVDKKEKADAPEDKWKGDMLAFSNRNANSERDLRAKDSEDPLMAIKRREQEAMQRMKSNSRHMKDAQQKKKKGKGQLP